MKSIGSSVLPSMARSASACARAMSLKPAFIDETLGIFAVLGPLMDFLTYSLDLPY